VFLTMKRAILALAFFSLVLLVFPSCQNAQHVASSSSHLVISADPQSIDIGESSTLTIIGTDGNGAFLPDGTSVSLSVLEAGRVTPSSVTLHGGTATSTYFSTNATGNMTITATSGGVQSSTTITVSDSLERKVFVSAVPATLPTGGGTSVITAVVTFGSGKPVQGDGVRFTTSSGTLQSGGAVIKTNSNGFAGDTLNTTTTATVTATTDDGFTGDTTVTAGTTLIVCHLSVSNASPKVNTPVQFVDTSDFSAGQITDFHWDFGDNSSADGQSVVHTYTTVGMFNVTHSVTDNTGNTTFCDPFAIDVSN
jgi:PKD repeat protein